MRTDNVLIFDGLDAATDHTSAAQQIEHGYVFSVTAVTTASAAGTLKVQISNDPADVKRPDLISSTSWVDLPDSSVTLNSSHGVINCRDAGYRWVRLVWTASGLNGTITVQYNCKGN